MTESDDEEWVRSSPLPAMADAPPPLPDSYDHADLQRIWLSTQRHAWRTLALVPVDEGVSAYEAASLITTLGVHHGESIHLADLRGLRLNRVPAFLQVCALMVSRGQRVVFATRSINDNLATIPLARAAEAVILCVAIGSTRIGLVEDAIAQIGKERFIGSMLIRRSEASVPPALTRSTPKLLEARS
jgi:hypothetical protein